ncbi:hypothetical protein PAE4_40096 [Bacillus altitudinis]|uniref:Uncharacterized protein n=1 Tax=Bacillus altitudinis TaxID=293387 RepID=A0A653LGX2_BACAB|nr:hypothetical protein PAE4_40096 [Bacillus altitudinis]VXA91004.1 hypothetical protein BACI348_110004 [Bacillus altitudinis]VXA91182.1 hypothetical protein BACI9J_100013 [Bacillus altitudinis]
MVSNGSMISFIKDQSLNHFDERGNQLWWYKTPRGVNPFKVGQNLMRPNPSANLVSVKESKDQPVI